jgi:hypothetical protein
VTVGVLALGLALGLGAAGAQPAINDGTGVEVNPERPGGERTPPPANDLRPIYVAGGIALFAALFLWNRRRRAELERDEEAFMRRSRTRARSARDREAAAIADDPDAADLRRAARGERPDEESTP